MSVVILLPYDVCDFFGYLYQLYYVKKFPVFAVVIFGEDSVFAWFSIVSGSVFLTLGLRCPSMNLDFTFKYLSYKILNIKNIINVPLERDFRFLESEFSLSDGWSLDPFFPPNVISDCLNL